MSESYEYLLSQKQVIRTLTDLFYDMQKLRIAAGNRIVAAVTDRKTATTDDENDAEDDASSVLKQLVVEFETIATKTAELGKKRVTDSIIHTCNLPGIKTTLHYDMVRTFIMLYKTEQDHSKSVSRFVQSTPLWEAFFKDVKGCGYMMAAVCMAYLDPYKARHVSSFWKYAGLDVVIKEDGTAVGRNRSCIDMRRYLASDGEVKEKRSLSYNPNLKTKLIGVLGTSFLRARDSQYGKIYYDYKHRLQNRQDLQEESAKHIHNMAIRYAVKMFLADLWVAWRTLEGLPVTEPYSVAYLDKPRHKDPNLGTSTELSETIQQIKLDLGE